MGLKFPQKIDQIKIVPTRIELRASQDGTVCSFTIMVPYVVRPMISDHIVFDFTPQLTTKIIVFCHYAVSDSACLAITDPILCNAYDDLLMCLDKFKAEYKIIDIKSDRQPHSYYILYRSVLELLDLSKEINPIVIPDPVSIKIFAEICRSVLLAELCGDQSIESAKIMPLYSNFNQAIADLHMMVNKRKKNEPNGVLILPVIKEWEQKININNKINWNATSLQCKAVARMVFSKLHSISADKLPLFLNN